MLVDFEIMIYEYNVPRKLSLKKKSQKSVIIIILNKRKHLKC